MLLITQNCLAQTNVQIEVYNKYKETTNPFLYNGIAYPAYIPGSIFEARHACFRDSICKPGTLVYMGRTYNDVALKYDIVIDEVAILHHVLQSEVVLRKSEVTEFSIGNTDFINIPKGQNIPPGYYELYQKGKTRILCKHRKTYMTGVNYNHRFYTMINEDDRKFYIEKNNQFHLVKNEKSLYEIFPDRKNELKDFIRRNELFIKETPGSSIPIVVEFINK
ncbi:hypothetical protein SAMN04487898_11845 [Pedobacter sp. ok626]|nr:hypothetical protein SAMN04487898_11845 [Pedobacter sp. ok626]